MSSFLVVKQTTRRQGGIQYVEGMERTWKIVGRIRLDGLENPTQKKNRGGSGRGGVVDTIGQDVGQPREGTKLEEWVYLDSLELFCHGKQERERGPGDPTARHTTMTETPNLRPTRTMWHKIQVSGMRGCSRSVHFASVPWYVPLPVPYSSTVL